jgi:hypothetical protein
MLLTLYVPSLSRLFRFSPPAAGDLALCLAAAVAGLLWYEIYKRLRAR